MSQKIQRPAFQPIEVDSLDARIEARAANKGIPSLVPPQRLSAPAAPEAAPPARPARGTPRSLMKSSKLEFPPYVWMALKRRALDENCSVRYLVLQSLRKNGFEIEDADMIEDGRRFR